MSLQSCSPRLHTVLGRSALVAMLVLASGCSLFDRAYVGTVNMVDPDQSRLKQETRWLNPHPNFRLVNQDQMVVYVRARDSANSGLNIRRDLKDALAELGYRLTSNLDEAQYILNIDIRYFGENARADGGRATLAAGIGGAVIGGVVGHQSQRLSGGATVGGLVAGLLFDTLAQRNKVREYDAVADVRVGERVKGGVRTTRRSDDGSSVRHSGSSGRGGYDSGSSAGGVSETQVVRQDEDFLYSQNRLVVWVKKMNLAPEEADGVLHRQLVQALSNVLP